MDLTEEEVEVELEIKEEPASPDGAEEEEEEKDSAENEQDDVDEEALEGSGKSEMDVEEEEEEEMDYDSGPRADGERDPLGLDGVATKQEEALISDPQIEGATPMVYIGSTLTTAGGVEEGGPKGGAAESETEMRRQKRAKFCEGADGNDRTLQMQADGDVWERFGRGVTEQLRLLAPHVHVVAEKLIMDILFDASLGQLSEIRIPMLSYRDSFLHAKWMGQCQEM